MTCVQDQACQKTDLNISGEMPRDGSTGTGLPRVRSSADVDVGKVRRRRI